jgi:hypothetical protein
MAQRTFYSRAIPESTAYQQKRRMLLVLQGHPDGRDVDSEAPSKRKGKEKEKEMEPEPVMHGESSRASKKRKSTIIPKRKLEQEVDVEPGLTSGNGGVVGSVVGVRKGADVHGFQYCT